MGAWPRVGCFNSSSSSATFDYFKSKLHVVTEAQAAGCCWEQEEAGLCSQHHSCSEQFGFTSTFPGAGDEPSKDRAVQQSQMITMILTAAKNTNLCTSIDTQIYKCFGDAATSASLLGSRWERRRFLYSSTFMIPLICSTSHGP